MKLQNKCEPCITVPLWSVICNTNFITSKLY